MQVLPVENHAERARSIAGHLGQEHCGCEVAGTCGEAQEKLALLEIMLPDGNGISLGKVLRKEGIEGSVIIISAQNVLDFRLSGLRKGADDYLTKPPKSWPARPT
jgi:DNA-binding response OmpR family regulator